MVEPVIAFQGEHGAYSEEAIRCHFGPGVTALPCETFGAIFEAIKSGAIGYLLKSMNADDLVQCLQQALEGVPPFSPGLATRLLGEFARLSHRPAPPPKPCHRSSQRVPRPRHGRDHANHR